MGNPRTEAARDHDDSALIDGQPGGTGGEAGRSGGGLATDVATEAELEEIDDPEGRERVRKQDTIDHAQEQRPDRPRA